MNGKRRIVNVLRWMAPRGYPEGFSYSPSWEVGVGWLLMVVAILMPLLYFKMNTAATREMTEWLFCFVFMIFFLKLGHSLAFQSFRAVITGGNSISISQDMRTPETALSRKLQDWHESRIGKVSDENGKEYAAVYFVGSDGPHELYRTVSPAEARAICEALEELRKSPAAVPAIDSPSH